MKKLLFSLLSLLMVSGLAWTGSSAVAATAADGETVTLTVYPQQLNERETPEYLYSVQVTCLKKGAAESEAVTKTTASEGNPGASFEGCDPAGTYVVTLHKEGYKDTVVETPATEEVHGATHPVSLNVVMKKVESAPVANGVKVSGTITLAGNSGSYITEGTATLLTTSGDVVKTVALVKSSTACTYEFVEVQSGTYNLRVDGRMNKDVYTKTIENVQVENTDIVQDVDLAKDNNHVYVTVQPKTMVQGQYGESPANIGGVQITCLKKGTSESETKTNSESAGSVVFYCDKVSTYAFTLHKEGYQDTTVETMAWVEVSTNYWSVPSLSIVMKKAPVVENNLVTLAGTVSLGTHTDISLSEKLQLFYRNGEATGTLYSDIQNGKYAFTNVPKNASYDSLSVVTVVYGSYGSTTYRSSAMLQVKTPANGVLDLSAATPVNDTINSNIELERIGFSVKGSVKNAANGSGLAGVTVKLGDVTVTTFNDGERWGSDRGDFIFDVVTATQLSFEFSKEGFATLTKDTTISMDAVGADGVVTLAPIAMTPQAQEYTLAGKAGIKPDTPLKDVVVELWSAPFVENQGYVKGNKLGADTTDADGAWSLKYTGFADDFVYLIAKHADMETEEMGRPISYLLNQTSIDIYGSPLLYGMVNCRATQDVQAATPTVNLTWEWPQALRNGYVNENGEGTYEITMVSIFRTVHRADEDYTVKVCDTTTVSNTLPLTSFVDAGVQYPLSVDSTYTYHFTVQYSGKPDWKTVEVKDSANLTVKIAAKPVEPAKDSFELKLQVNDPTMGSVEGEGKYEEGTEVTIKAIANEGYVFQAWKAGETEISKEAEHKVTMMSDSTLKAFFAVKPVNPVKDSFNLRLQVNDATMGSVEGEGKYEKGQEAAIKATANEGYVFVAWMSGNDTVAKTAEHKVTMTSDSTLKAFFAVKPVNPVKDSFELKLQVNDTAMGKVEGEGKYEEGTEVTIKAVANEGYVFVAWMSGNDTVAKTAEHKVTMTSDSTLTAVFAAKPSTANEDREQAAWNVYTEGQTIVLQSNAACQYDVYNMAGALVKRAKTNSNEYRIAVNNSGLYIIRRISATGISVKKVMVR